MTREEQIKEAAHEYIQSDSVSTGNEMLAFGDFINGAKWADSHHQWIPVEERLPEKENEFEDFSKLVVVTNGKDFWKGMYNYRGDDWRTFDLWLIDDATHWMEIVPPRKEE